MPIPVIERRALEYKTEDGRTPFRDWVVNLVDARAQAKITKAVTKMEGGNFGDHKSVADGLFEYRIDYGPGYRIYYITEGDELIILFAGSDKSDQQEAIDQAKNYLADYKTRKPKTTSKQTMGRGPSKKRNH
jgi:putative addiction module killer protein